MSSYRRHPSSNIQTSDDEGHSGRWGLMRERKRKSDDGRAAARGRWRRSGRSAGGSTISAGAGGDGWSSGSLARTAVFRLFVRRFFFGTIAWLLRLRPCLLWWRPWHTGRGDFAAEPARAAFGMAIHPRASIGEHAAAAAATTTLIAVAAAATVAVTIAPTTTAAVAAAAATATSGDRGAVCAGAGAAEGDGEVFGRDKVEEECRVLLWVVRAEDGDLVERARSEPRLYHAPDGSEGRRCVDDDQLAHPTNTYSTREG